MAEYLAATTTVYIHDGLLNKQELTTDPLSARQLENLVKPLLVSLDAKKADRTNGPIDVDFPQAALNSRQQPTAFHQLQLRFKSLRSSAKSCINTSMVVGTWCFFCAGSVTRRWPGIAPQLEGSYVSSIAHMKRRKNPMPGKQHIAMRVNRVSLENKLLSKT